MNAKWMNEWMNKRIWKNFLQKNSIQSYFPFSLNFLYLFLDVEIYYTSSLKYVQYTNPRRKWRLKEKSI